MNQEFLAVVNLINSQTGLVLTRNQVVNFKTSFENFLKEKNITVDEAVKRLTESHEDFQQVLEILLIKESYFFRNTDHFRVLKDVIFPVFFDKFEFGGEKEIRILCVGCSTGQEPLSILISFLESVQGKVDFNIKIDAVDLSKHAILKAIKGEYTNLETRGLSPEHIENYFTKSGNNTLKVKNSLLDKITYYHKSIAEHPLIDNYYHVIFVRNILIYFDEVHSERAKQKLVKSLRNGGYLFLGESEIGWGLGTDIQPIKFNQSLVYRKR